MDATTAEPSPPGAPPHHDAPDRLSAPCSPLDVFYYSNDPRCGAPNCDVHVDRGWLSCVPVAAVPGLQLQSQISGRWLAIEEVLTPYRDVVVFVNMELQCAVDGAGAASQRGKRGPTPWLVSCTHRVVKADTGTPRLSLNYELRSVPDGLPSQAAAAATGTDSSTPSTVIS